MLAGVRGRLLVSSVCAMCAYTNLRSYIHSSDVDIKKPQDERNDRPYSISQAMCKKRNEGMENSAPLWPPHLGLSVSPCRRIERDPRHRERERGRDESKDDG